MTGQIRAAGNVPILVVSGESGEGAKVKALEIGADDYLTKPFGKAELLASISAIMRRADAATGSTGVAGGGPLEAGPLTIDPGRHEARIGAAILNLTATEYRLLEALVRARRGCRPAPPPGPSRVASRVRPRPALAQAPHRPTSGEGPQGRRAGDRRGPLGRLPDRGLTGRILAADVRP